MKAILLLLSTAAACLADVPVVEQVVATQRPDGWTIAVTVRHTDEGWDHYADSWSVFTPDGTELAHRVLAHPHVDEQPFTRTLSGVAIPDGESRLIVQAHDLVHGWGPDFEFVLP